MVKFDRRITKSEAARLMQAERERLPQVQKSFMDSIVDSLVTSKKDTVVFANASDGLHVFVNGAHRGFFMKEKKGLVWRVA